MAYRIFSPDTVTVRNIHLHANWHPPVHKTHTLSSLACVWDHVFVHVCSCIMCRQCSCSAGTQRRCHPVLKALLCTKTRWMIWFSMSPAPCGHVFVISCWCGIMIDWVKCSLIKFLLLLKRRLGSLEVIEHFTLMSFERDHQGMHPTCYYNEWTWYSNTVSKPSSVQNEQALQWCYTVRWGDAS